MGEWRKDVAWIEAASYSLTDQLSCHEVSTSSAGTKVHCVYGLNALGSEKLGLGPYEGNTYDPTVLNGKITRAEEKWPYLESGFSDEMWEPFQAWASLEHPANHRLINTDRDTLSGARFDRYLRVWRQSIAEWVATQQ